MTKSIFSRSFVCLIVLTGLFFGQVASAEIIGLTVDPNLSGINLDIGGSADSSDVSGTGVIDLFAHSTPGATAQFTALDLTLDDGLTFGLGFGLGATTNPGDVTVSLVTPGAPGAIDAAGLFDQLGNVVQFNGIINATDALGLVFPGGSGTIDLSTLAPASVDFLDFQITTTGNIKTVSGNFAIVTSVPLGAAAIPVTADGTFSASGEVPAVPEPSSLLVLALACGTVLVRRNRA